MIDHNMIELKAYLDWIDRGRPIGTPEVDWYRAECEVTLEDEKKKEADLQIKLTAAEAQLTADQKAAADAKAAADKALADQKAADEKALADQKAIDDKEIARLKSEDAAEDAAEVPPVPPPATPLLVTAKAPADKAIDVALDTKVSATFSAKLDGAITTNGNFHLHEGTGTAAELHAAGAKAPLASSVVLDATGMIATLTPAAPLTAGLTYTPMLKKATADEKGNTLADDVLWTFTTKQAAVVPPTPPPVVPPVAPKAISQSPASNATGVSGSSHISVTFDKKMKASSITASTLRLRAAGEASDVQAVVALESDGLTATLTPVVLLKGSVYTVTLAGSVTDESGTAMGSDLVWSFTVVPSAPVPPTPAPGGPSVTITPAQAAVNVPVTSTVAATFNRAMNSDTISTSTFTLRAAGATADVPATIQMDAGHFVATLTPNSPLAAHTEYTVTVFMTVKDASPQQVPLGTDTKSSFTTA